MNVIIIQPPIVQLNTAYPSGAYLSAFFKKQGCTVKWYDMNIELFHALFCKEGITKLFTLTEKDAVKKAEAALRQNDEATYSNIMAYLSMGEAWAKWIDVIVQILEDGNSFSTRELCHRFVFSPDVPRGARMNAYLENLDHEPGTDDARFLASLAVADLADYITAVFDPQFSLVRYAESIAVSEASFANIENKIDSPVLANFYEELLKKTFSPENSLLKNTGDEKTLVCISIPFAGTFTAALCTGRFFKQNFSDKVFVSAGGGFINTELRECEETAVEKYFDSISYDRGYGSYLDFFTHGCKTSDAGPLYKMRLFKNGTVTAPKETDAAIQKEEDELTSIIVPDFSDIDFSLYPRMLDDVNPMQRLWSDGTWIKAYLA
ncbi:MAG: radical SAM protein, partial [Treponema sp.]|nr:radical SAM protein [Treponema sp.]